MTLIKIFLLVLSLFNCKCENRSDEELEMKIQEGYCHLKCPNRTLKDTCQLGKCNCSSNDVDLSEFTKTENILDPSFVYCVGETSLSFKWNKTTDVINFIELTNGSTTHYTPLTGCGNISVTNLTNDAEYKVKMLRIAKDDHLSLSKPFNIRTRPKGKPLLPVKNLTLVGDPVFNNGSYQQTISWFPAEDHACFYRMVVFDNMTNESPRVYIQRGPSEIYEYLLRKLVIGAFYTAQVKATSTDGNIESETASVHFQTPSCLETYRSIKVCVPPKPKNLIAEEIPTDINPEGNYPLYNVKISWKKPEDYLPDNYTARLITSTNKNNTPDVYYLNISGEATEATFENVEIGFFFRVSLAANSPAGRSDYAETIQHVSGNRATIIATMPHKEGSHTKIMYLSIIISAMIFVVLTVVGGFYIYKYVKEKGQRKRNINEHFEDLDHKIRLNNMSIENIINEFDDWEVEEKKLMCLTTVGEGAFGLVKRALLETDEDKKIEVAIKMLKETSSADDVKQLYQEMEIMRSVGSHQHLVSMIGCVTKSRPHSPLLIVEYCSRGNLQNYLRATWNKILSHRNQTDGDNISPENTEKYTCFNKMYDLGDEDDSYVIQPKDLISFARQIVIGMEYLSQMKVLHRDLAARNVLVCEDRSIKVSDFGLSRDVYQDSIYCKTGSGKLPIKWMAIESLTHQRYTTQSDVWSFGVLLWEIVTLGGDPYAGISTKDLPKLLQRGYRMEKPKNCSNELYDIMKSCWNHIPQERPTFSDLKDTFEALLHNMTEYLNLDFSGSSVETFSGKLLTKTAENSVPPERYITPVSKKL